MASGTLHLVATPIGNLGDVTLRALEVLRVVPLIAAEDTRVTRRLLTRYEITTRTTSYHAHSDPARTAELLDHLRGGADLALVTDAGTPGVSDPGAELAAAWAVEGGRVEAIPGASAVMVAVVVTGIAGPRWSFEGFLPRRGRDRRDRLARIGADERGTVIFEAPRRLGGTIDDLVTACGADRPAAICRELTKMHEQVIRGTLGELARTVAGGSMDARGESVVVIGWSDAIAATGDWRRSTAGATARGAEDPLPSALARVETLVSDGVARGEAARRVARETGLSRRVLYRVS
ncbi:MAG: 16S rRNA (cytidine(1402)-2'-O)-methyltransferase [Chloroflexi bacterium]|nr:16S rRNA (cytidine(1402)-2'-O)-methyltransferase [Chloroflexota bacterium]